MIVATLRDVGRVELRYRPRSSPRRIIYINIPVASLSLREVIAAYGEPTHLLPTAVWPTPLPHGAPPLPPVILYDYDIYYLNHGFMVRPNTIGLARDCVPEIRPDVELIAGVLFFEPSPPALIESSP